MTDAAGSAEPPSASRIYRPSPSTGFLRQAEIVSDLSLLRLKSGTVETGPENPMQEVTHPFAIVVSQDCDLAQAFEGSGLPSVLFCEVHTAEALRSRPKMNSTLWDRIKKNKDERYQFLQVCPDSLDGCAAGLPELCIDFKSYFTIPSVELARKLEQGRFRRRCCLQSPYLEHFTQRFSGYMCRVALPAQHESER